MQRAIANCTAHSHVFDINTKVFSFWLWNIWKWFELEKSLANSNKRHIQLLAEWSFSLYTFLFICQILQIMGLFLAWAGNILPISRVWYEGQKFWYFGWHERGKLVRKPFFSPRYFQTRAMSIFQWIGADAACNTCNTYVARTANRNRGTG